MPEIARPTPANPNNGSMLLDIVALTGFQPFVKCPSTSADLVRAANSFYKAVNS